MNLYYKILIMMFLIGAGAGASLLILGREIACQITLGTNVYISIAAAYAAGAGLAVLSKIRLKKSTAPVLNMVISFSAIAGVFAMLGALMFVRYYKVFLGITPEQAVPPLYAVILPVIIYLPGAVFVSVGLVAAETLASLDKAAKPQFTGAAAAAGFLSGMLLHVLFLWRYYVNIDVLYALGILVLAATYVLFRDKTMEGRWTMLAVITAFIIYLAFNIGGFKEKADRASNRAMYKAYFIVAEKEFPTLKFVMAKKGGELMVFENGFLTYKMPDAKYADMAGLATGKNIIIINGGAAGLIEAVGKTVKAPGIISYEADPYTAYILENLFKNEHAQSPAVFKSGDILKDEEQKKNRYLADTLFINPRPAGPKPYLEKRLEGLKNCCLAQSGKVVISALPKDAETVKGAVKKVFKNMTEEKGFITAVNSR